ncbi:MAG: hypothetical protein AMXMBFR7_06780 [Planctomycetota bacterium]
MTEEGNAKPAWERSPVRVVTVLVVLVSVGVLWEINTAEVKHYKISFEPGLTIRTTGWPADYVRVMTTWPHGEVTYWLPTGILINCLVALGYLFAMGLSMEWWLRCRPINAEGWPTFRVPVAASFRLLQMRLSTLLVAMLIAGVLLGLQTIRTVRVLSIDDDVTSMGWPLPAILEISRMGGMANLWQFDFWSLAANGWFGFGLLFIGASVWEMGCARREFLAKAKGDA